MRHFGKGAGHYLGLIHTYLFVYYSINIVLRGSRRIQL